MESATYELQQHLENSNSDVSAASEVLQSSIKVSDILTVGPIVKNDAQIMMKKIVMIMMMMEEASPKAFKLRIQFCYCYCC